MTRLFERMQLILVWWYLASTWTRRDRRKVQRAHRR